MRGTRKKMKGNQHPDRDDQFRYITKQAEDFLAAADPVINVDTKRPTETTLTDQPKKSLPVTRHLFHIDRSDTIAPLHKQLIESSPPPPM
ncbi:MAG: hypothetical protein JO100_18220 [Pseudonocardia sp.]|nr:hypothetical protein [Pseudonocardia sp.]